MTACPIERGYIFSLKGVDKVVGIVASEVFDGEVINTEAESGGTGSVTPKAGGVRNRKIIVFSKMFYQFVVG